MTEQYYQCKMSRDGFFTTGWIEARGAKVGNRVELLPEGHFWEVVEVYNGISADVLRETQRQRRQGLPSIRDTKKDKRQQELKS